MRKIGGNILMKKHKIIIWCIAIFFILEAIAYIEKNTIPAIMLLIAGIFMIPPVNQKIENAINNSEKLIKYKTTKNILIVVFFLVFIANISDTAQIDNSLEVNTTNNVNTEINENTNKSSDELTEKNGKYIGDIVNGTKQGNGKFEWNSGSVYEGEFSNNKINGIGKMTIPNLGEYEGNFVEGKRYGKGKYTFVNGDRYDGEWKDDKMNGQGVYIFANGDKYDGTFLNNKFNGSGTYTKDGKQYTGTWENNEYKK